MDEDEEGESRRRQEAAASKQPYHKYRDMMRELADRKIDEVLIELDDVQQVPSSLSYGDARTQPLTVAQWEQEVGDDVAALKLVQSIEVNTKHYIELLSRAIDECMPPPAAEPTYTSPKLHLLLRT